MVKTTGDWAAADGFIGSGDAGDQRTFVWNIATGQTWVLPNRPGHHFSRVFAVTPTEIVVGERITKPIPDQVLDHIVRIDLAALPPLVLEWSK